MNKEVQVRQHVVGENSHLYIFKKYLNFTFLATVLMSSVLSVASPKMAIYFSYLAISFNLTYLTFVIILSFLHKEYDTSKFINYLFKAGKEVKELKGDVKKTASIKNVIKNLYINKSAWTQHAIIVGASGSGKTVFVNAIQKQLLNSGAGFLFLDGKGSNSMLKQVYGLTLLHGRENDFMLVNFGEKETVEDMNVNTISGSGPSKMMRHTHKYNPMAILDKDSMQDILGDMIDTTGDNAEWAEKAVILGNAIGETLIVLRDLDLLIRPEDTIEVYTYEQLKDSDKKVVLTFALFKDYLSSLYNNIALTVMIDRLNVNEEFRRMVYEAFQIRDLKERLQDAVRSMARIDYQKQLKDKLLFIDDWTEFIDVANKELSKKHDAEYTHDVAKDYWNKVFSIFAAYTDVLDTPFSEIDFKDVVMNQKILYITLPGLKNKVTTSILAKIIVNSIKSVAVQKWKEYQITHPFTCFLDEANVWGEDEDDLIVQIGQMYRQTREAGITLCVIHQDGLGEKQGAIYGSANNVFALRVLDKDLAEHLEAFFGELEIAEFAITDKGSEVRRDQKKDTQRQEAKVEKEPLAKKGDFSTLDSGEGFCAIKGVGRMKFITEYNMPIMFEPKEKRITNIPLPELMPKKIFLENLASISQKEETPTQTKDTTSTKVKENEELPLTSVNNQTLETNEFDDLMNFSDVENKMEKDEEKTEDEFNNLMDFSDVEKPKASGNDVEEPTLDSFDDLMDFSDIEDRVSEKIPEKEEQPLRDFEEEISKTEKKENRSYLDFEENNEDRQTLPLTNFDDKNIIPQQKSEKRDFLEISPPKRLDLELIPKNSPTSEITAQMPPIEENEKIDIPLDNEDSPKNTLDISNDISLDIPPPSQQKEILPSFNDNINLEKEKKDKNSIPVFDPLNVKDPFKDEV
jgi:hypothetical protein